MLAVDRRCFKGEDCHKFPEPCRLTIPPLGSPHDHYNLIALFYFLKFFVPLDATCTQAQITDKQHIEAILHIKSPKPPLIVYFPSTHSKFPSKQKFACRTDILWNRSVGCPCNSTQSRFLQDFLHTFTLILPWVTCIEPWINLTFRLLEVIFVSLQIVSI